MPRGPIERLRAYQACQNCRKKKIRCPSEKPACSSCTRLNQTCIYDVPRSSDRLADLETKVDLILSATEQRDDAGSIDEDLAHEWAHDVPNAQAITSSTYSILGAPNSSLKPFCSPQPELQIPIRDNSGSAFTHDLDVYFQRVHRQPIWCFDRQDLGCITQLSEELRYSILELTARFSHDHDPQRYGESARRSIMLRIANDKVGLETIESLCLLAYSAFLDGNMHLGQFYLGLGFQLCRSAKLDPSSRLMGSPITEREKRLFWSLQSLEQFYGDQGGVLRQTPEVWRPYYLSHSNDVEFPSEPDGGSTVSDVGIWSFSVHFGWVWSRVREYVFDCSQKKLTEPWRLDSVYAKVLSDLTEIENKVPLHHRYDVVRFFERRPDEVNLNKDYWLPWLKLQFTWHSIMTMINHPFLYITASQHHPNLTIPNTFWRKSSELVLLHATWIARTIDMAQEKKLQLLDPFFAHAAAIAATVHLYFGCTADFRLRKKSKTDFEKCQKFLKGFSSFSPACESLGQLLDELSRIASQSDPIDYEWMPSRRQINIPLMWAVLKFDISRSQALRSTVLANSPNTPSNAVDELERNQALEISVTATTTGVTINPALGHDSQLPPYQAGPISPEFRSDNASPDIVIPSAERFLLHSPWLWAQLSQFTHMEDGDDFLPDSPSNNLSNGFFSWWNMGNL
ncbi:hypothetical protein BDV36DRAFT_269391 [Aspergillus pseudocaelatus]|uniref:Zn(2)-C6 fungal-type domain-containing protein n=1 Tax=Aspergillus pseudocaelatus TaxID=1825620 RepID=A0ABQ6W7K8_9EURO|nr:hypothetical protein BDV36DRAFT_269391 [Aspergillus pseudocaelatus]